MYSIRLLFAVLLLTGIAACSVQPVDPTADIPVMSFKTDISPIISANCAVSGCHDGSGGELGALLTYDDVINYAKVKPQKPHDSDLYTVIRLYSGEKAMPPAPNEPLSDEQIARIYVWILQGAKNN